MGTYSLLDLTPKGRDERRPAAHDGVGAAPRPLRAAAAARGAARAAHANGLRPRSPSPDAARHGEPVAVAGDRRPRRPSRPEPGHRLDARRRAAACRRATRAQARRALVPIAIGHVASIAVVVVRRGARALRWIARWCATWPGALLVGAALVRWLRGAGSARRARRTSACRTAAGHAGIALWSFLMATAHGAGLMLVPALVPLCLADASGARDHGIGLAGRWRWRPSAFTRPRCWSRPASSPPACAAASLCTLAC